jgi:hypothetical protein
MGTLCMDGLNPRADHAPGIAVIYAALDAYADRVLADDNRRRWLKTQARVAFLAGASRAAAIAQANADDAALYPGHGNFSGSVA